MNDTPADDCGGIPGHCPQCIELYRAQAGIKIPYCQTCQTYHWVYETHMYPVLADSEIS